MGGERQYDGVRAASTSTIEIDFYYAGRRCRERIKLEPTPANLKRAANHRAAILAAIDQGVFDYAVTFPKSANAKKLARYRGQTLILATYLDEWLSAKANQLKASTYDDYLKTFNGKVIPEFGKRPLTELTRADFRKWCASLDCGNKRIANILSPVRTALADAVEDGLIPSNPLHDWTFRKAEAPREDDDVDPFDAGEQAAILAKLEGQARNFVQFAFWTGMRTSELVALNWADVDFRSGVVRVRKATTQAMSRKARIAVNLGEEDVTTVEAPKTSSGRRDIKLLSPALAALQAQKAFTWLAGEEVFQNPRTNEGWTGDQAIRKTMWTPALKRAGIRYRRPYQTRHTYASMMLSAGESPMWVAQQMGHRDWGMIRRVYGRFIPSADPDAGSRAERVFSRAPVATDLASNGT